MILNYSPNMLKTYKLCPRKYYFKYIERVNVPILNTPFEKGKKIHALANYYLQNIDISKIEAALTPEEKQTWRALQNNDYFKMKCIETEYQLSSKLGVFWLGGRMDALMQDGNSYYILDYKTGSVPDNPKYDYQTMIYLTNLDKSLESYETINFVYIDLKRNKDLLITYNAELKAEYQDKITDICKKISSDKAYSPNHQSCKNCEYSHLCSKSL